MTQPLMPKATAVWLIENTSLTFEKIAAFCGLHILEVQAIADTETSAAMVGFDPIASGQLTQQEIERCEQDSSAELILNPPIDASSFLPKKQKKYTPVAKRQDRPDAIAWILKYHPEISESQICKLLGTTKLMIQSIRSKAHWNSANIKPRNPIQLGLCTENELQQALNLVAKTEGAQVNTEDEE
jgi:hypothetical protein